LGTPQDECNVKEEEESEVTEKDLLERWALSQLWGDAETRSNTIEKNGVVNCVVISYMVDRIGVE